MPAQPIPASYRDPAGYVVCEAGVYKRVVTPRGQADYDRLMGSGLHAELVDAGLVVAHTEEEPTAVDGEVHRLLRPEQIPFLSYPYEWSFSQLRDAALLTLDIQQRALRQGMTLKDASPFNVQFLNGRPVLIDTLSLETDNGGPWVAYEQFCRLFLAPLLLECRTAGAIQWLRAEVDGFPLERASRMLGWRSYLRPGALMHIHLHARAQRAYSGENAPGAGNASNPKPAIAASLQRMVERLEARRGSVWSNYDQTSDHYPPAAAAAKRSIVRAAIQECRPALVYDLGGNTGVYSRLAASEGCRCVLFDADPVSIDVAYRREKDDGSGRVLPLVMDLRNPSPALGFDLSEMQSVLQRPAADLAMALAVVHHLRLSAAIPFARQAEFFARLGRTLLVEYVPPEDPQARRMLARVGEAPEDYSHQGFVAAFSRHFALRSEKRIPEMDRRLFLFER